VADDAREPPAPHRRILLGLVAGALAGAAARAWSGSGSSLDRMVAVAEPLGRVWLAALVMVVIPLVLSSLAVGVAGLGGLSRRLGRIGAITFLGFGVLTTLSTLLGLFAMGAVQPGSRLDPAVRAELLERYGERVEAGREAAPPLGADLLIRIVPRNPVKAAADGEMLPVIFFSLMLGLALAGMPAERARALLSVLESLGHTTVAMIGLVMRLAPYAVFCLIFAVTARFGNELLLGLAGYVATVLGSLLLFQTLGYALVLRLVAGREPLEFFRKTQVVVLTAFSTSSSNATLPTTLRTAREQLGVPGDVAGFVLPLGATLNMNGTALFEGATVLFLAQVFGVPLDPLQQLLVVALSVLTAIGTAGVPGGSIPLLMTVLAVAGVPVEGIAIVLGVDRLLDMCRTVLNVTGDLVVACVVMRFAPVPTSLANPASPVAEPAPPRSSRS